MFGSIGFIAVFSIVSYAIIETSFSSETKRERADTEEAATKEEILQNYKTTSVPENEVGKKHITLRKAHKQTTLQIHKLLTTKKRFATQVTIQDLRRKLPTIISTVKTAPR